MEEALLHEMLGEREERIKEIKGKIKVQEEKKLLMKQNLEIAKDKSAQAAETFAKQIFENKRTQAKLQKDLSKKNRELTHQSSTLHLYADIMRDTMPELVQSNYVIRIQSQLCGAMHAMYILDQEMEMLKEHCVMIIKPLRDVISNNFEENCKTELELMNELVVVDDEKRTIEQSYKEKLKSVESQLSEMLPKQQTVEDDNEEGSHSSEDDEEDDDESYADEHSMEDIDKEILYLEEENLKQIQQIESLKEKIKLLSDGSKEPRTPEIICESVPVTP